MANEPLRGCPTCGTPVSDVAMGLRDYRWVSESLPGKVAPMDLDFVLEKNGHFLVMENKPLGQPIPLGQRLTLKQLVRLGMEVWVVWAGKPSEKVEVGTMDRNGNVPFVAAITRNKLKHKVVEWLEEATYDVS